MKNVILNFIIIFFLSSSYGQTKNLTDLKQSVDQSWITTNPVIKETKVSFFNEKNHSNFLILDLNFNGYSIPFAWDCDFTILDFLSKNKYIIKKESHKFNEKEYTTTHIEWTSDLNGLLWFRDKIYESKIEGWHLENYFECIGTISFPNIKFKKIIELKNAMTNMEKGLAIIPFTNEIQDITRNKIELISENGELMNGIGYDVNKDNITDIFIHYQELDDEGFTGYKRLYVNINGKWTCKWIEYYEECI